MCHSLLTDARFHASLLKLDQEAAAAARAGGCPRCSGSLHTSNFPRKPRGGPPLPAEHDIRLSLCCSRDGCRSRVTPPSMRFLGRRVYWAAVVILVSSLRNGPTPTLMRRLQELVGMSRRTVESWCKWWRSAFCEGDFWREASGAFVPPVSATSLPSSLHARFTGDEEKRLLGVLRFLGPITGGTASLADRGYTTTRRR